MADDCIFCKIVKGEIPSKKVFEDDEVLAFHDINPTAPIHILVIPKQHITSTASLTADHAALTGRVILAAAQVAREQGIEENGYRLLTNTNKDGGQVVFHMHWHLVGGRKMTWPPG